MHSIKSDTISHIPNQDLTTEGQGRGMESLQLKDYLQKIEARKKEKKPRDRLAELVEPYYQEWNWQDDTFFGDMVALWVYLRRYMKSHTEAQLNSILAWSKGKSVHPRGIIKILRK